MTLDTRMYVLDEVDVREMFHEAQRLLGLADEDKRGPDRQKWSDNGKCIANEPMQNLPGWLMVYYRPGAAYRTAEESAAHKYCNHPDSDYFTDKWPTCAETEHDPACWAEISIDTAYGYRGPNGMGCGDLHAVFVAAMGEWLDAKGSRWKWRNEFTSEIHEGYDRLIDIASGGFEASAWFRTAAMPAIAAHIAKDGDR